MTKMPEITTAIRIPEPVARNISAMFIAIFLFDFEFEWKSKTPGEPFRRALTRVSHPDQSLLGKKFEIICVLVDLPMCHFEADTAPVE